MVESHYHCNIPGAESNAPYGKHLDYEKLKDATILDCAHMLQDGLLEHDRGWNHWLPQSHWIKDKDGRDRIDYKLRFDNLDEDLNQLCRELGVEYKALDRINVSSKGSYSELFDPESRDIIKKYYAEDIDRFGFEF